MSYYDAASTVYPCVRNNSIYWNMILLNSSLALRLLRGFFFVLLQIYLQQVPNRALHGR